MKLVIRWAITAVALVAAVWLIPGIRIESQNAWIAVGLMAVILGFVNAIIRPVLMFFSCGCIVLTMGLFMIVVNGLALWSASWISVNVFNVGFYVDGLWPAILGSIVVSIVSFLLSLLLPDNQ
ncbi:MAG: phage holin family protein [Anaerolineales bacterium]|jgi:putative membrane protein|nr:MAG: phage holin family protein [Anaerolineales bacterium]